MRVILPEGELPVFWDINRCPVPVDFDARRVGPCIERVLRKLGHSDPISITAVGILSKVPKEILEAISSPLQYFPLYRRNVAKMNGEHVILPFPVLWYNLPLEGVCLSFHLSQFCFPFFPEDVKVLEPWVCAMCGVLEEISPEDVKCSKTGEPANWFCWFCETFFCSSQEDAQEEEEEDELEISPEAATWVCGVCLNLPGRGFENFLAHLASQVHAELDQVDDLDDNFLEEVIKHPSQVHWWFGDKTMMSEEEAIIAESALRILQSEFPHLFPKEDQVDDLDDNPEEVLNDPSLEPCLFGDKTILSEEEATIAKEALRIFRIGL